MSSRVILSFQEAQNLASAALRAHGSSPDIADCVASALVLADADGQASHGLIRVSSYIEQLRSQKVNAQTEPSLTRINSSTIEVNANCGFAYPAIKLAVNSLTESCSSQGIMMAAIVNSHHCGVAGHPVEILARNGFIGIMFANTPKAIAAAGGKHAVFGTNPISFACPRIEYEPVIIDLSLSQVARGKIVVAAEQGKPIPDDWGMDAKGKPTTDPKEVLKGSMKAFGGEKGAALAMMVEILAGAFLNSNFGFEASSFLDDKGSSPNVGQLLICINATQFNPDFKERVETLIAEISEEPNTRIPGTRRFINRKAALASGLSYPNSLIESIRILSERGPY